MKKLFQPAARLHLVLAVAAGMAFSAGIGVASGAIPSSDGKINACQAKVGGFRYLRLLDSGESCHGGEKPLSWNQKGPAGGGGFSHIVERGSFTNVPPGVGSAFARCDPGQIAISAGYDVLNESATVIPQGLTPTSVASTEWGLKVINNSGTTAGIAMKVLCAS
jgi:hypothetical protein